MGGACAGVDGGFTGARGVADLEGDAYVLPPAGAGELTHARFSWFCNVAMRCILRAVRVRVVFCRRKDARKRPVSNAPWRSSMPARADPVIGMDGWLRIIKSTGVWQWCGGAYMWFAAANMAFKI